MIKVVRKINKLIEENSLYLQRVRNILMSFMLPPLSNPQQPKHSPSLFFTQLRIANDTKRSISGGKGDLFISAAPKKHKYTATIKMNSHPKDTTLQVYNNYNSAGQGRQNKNYMKICLIEL